MLCPLPWSCLALVSGLVSRLVFSCLPACLRSGDALVWDAVSACLVLSCSCLPICLPTWLGCCALLSVVLSPNKPPVWDAVSASLVSSCSCLRFCLATCLRSGDVVSASLALTLVSPSFSFLSPNLSPAWDAASTSLVSSCACLPTSLRSGMLCPLPWSRLALVSGFVSQLVFFLFPSLSLVWHALDDDYYY